uniref:Uncharacterized protein n=1 Tax=Rhizophora mucronata TaxID=61149 RepID=A0A2P2N4P6_RHIMU
MGTLSLSSKGFIYFTLLGL